MTRFLIRNNVNTYNDISKKIVIPGFYIRRKYPLGMELKEGHSQMKENKENLLPAGGIGGRIDPLISGTGRILNRPMQIWQVDI